MESEIKLRDYQSESVEAAFRSLKAARSNKPLVCLPTGSGKSLVIAELARRAVHDFNGRVLVLQHRAELIEQNADKITSLLPGEDGGIYSASLGKKSPSNKIVVAGIQSVYAKAELLAPRNLVIVDEAHLINLDSDSTMYSRLFNDLAKSQPSAPRIVGLTATPFRTGSGDIYGDGKMFSEICYTAGLVDLIDRGFLCDLAMPSDVRGISTEGVIVKRGEYDQAECLARFRRITSEAIQKTILAAKDRKSVIVFCSGVEHAAEVCSELSKLDHGEAAIITGETHPLERMGIIEKFRLGEIRWLVNCDVLTTGFDAPNVDCVVLLRATVSKGLYSQMIGRGLRIAPSKKDCLVLDFGGNVRRHGSLDDIRAEAAIEKRVKETTEKTVREGGRMCPACYNHVKTGDSACSHCGFTMPMREPTHSENFETNGAIVARVKKLEVREVRYSLHRTDRSTTMRVDYLVSGSIPISEFISFESQYEFARRRASAWWLERSEVVMPKDSKSAVTLATFGALREPKTIEVRFGGKYPEIIKCEWSEPRPEEANVPSQEDMPF